MCFTSQPHSPQLPVALPPIVGTDRIRISPQPPPSGLCFVFGGFIPAAAFPPGEPPEAVVKRRAAAYIDGLAHQTNLTLQQEIREGVPYEEIVALAAAINADLIVMGHVGRRGPRRILIASVTERVIEFAHCPVLVAKQ